MRDKYFDWIKILAGIGILLATYLLWEQAFPSKFIPCNINSTVNCNAVISGAVSKTLGIPTPLVGFIGYIVIMFAAFRKNAKLVLGMAIFGLAFCLYIAFRELFQLHVVCPVCVTCQLDMITVFVLGLLLVFQKAKSDNANPL